jgi:hypothetical protein
LQTVVFDDPATDSQTDPLLGFHAGVALARTVGGRLSVEADLLLSREGFRGGGGHTGDLKRDFLSVPVLLRLRPSRRVPLHLDVGGTAKLGVRCRQSNVALIGGVGCDDTIMGADWSRLDVAGLAGVGVALPWGGRTLTTDLLLSWGLRDLNKRLFVPGSARSLSVGVSFALLSPWGATAPGGPS